MATATVDLGNPAQRKAEAQKHFNIICKAAVPVSVNSLRIGYHAAILKRDSLFGILGFETDKQAQEASGVKESTWHNVIRIAQAYDGVDEESFVAMKLSNAETLMDLPESKRMSKRWLGLAASKSMEEFADLVTAELNGDARPSAGRENVVQFQVKMPKTRKKAVESGLLEYAESVGAKGDMSRGLELMVAERKGSVSLIESITKAMERIGKIKEFEASGLSADEILEKVNGELEEMAELFRAALNGVQNLDSPE
jgi:hypothetical protein